MSAGYIRVSSRGQDHAMQRLAIERAAAARGDTIDTWYAEKRTAKTMDRPELGRLLGDLRAGRSRRLYVFRLDRLTRSGIADTLALVREFRGLGVELVNLSDGFTIPPPGEDGSAARISELILAILAWAAEMELLTRRERIAAARELADERGEAWGRPSRTTLADKQRILARAAGGATVRAIAQAERVPRSTVARILLQATRGASRNAPPSETPAKGPSAAPDHPASR